MKRSHDTTTDNPRDGKKSKLVGRTFRLMIGALLIISVAPVYFRESSIFTLTTLGLDVVLVVFYSMLHLAVSKYLPQLNKWLGAILALVPVVFLYIFGIDGGYIFGAGEGQLAALTYLGVSLVFAGIRGDWGCEVMSIPNIILGKQTHLACIVFSPVDWLEGKYISRK